MAIEQMTVTVSPDLAAELQRRVDDGGYASASEIVHDALEDWMLRHDDGEDIEALREAIRIGDESGPSIPADEVFDRLLRVVDEYRTPR